MSLFIYVPFVGESDGLLHPTLSLWIMRYTRLENLWYAIARQSMAQFNVRISVYCRTLYSSTYSSHQSISDGNRLRSLLLALY
jgi:hypothetical protein